MSRIKEVPLSSAMHPLFMSPYLLMLVNEVNNWIWNLLKGTHGYPLLYLQPSITSNAGKTPAACSVTFYVSLIPLPWMPWVG